MPTTPPSHGLHAVFGVTHRFAELRYHFLRDQQIETYRSHVRFMVEGDPPAGTGDLELLRTEPPSQSLTTHEDLRHWLGLGQANH